MLPPSAAGRRLERAAGLVARVRLDRADDEDPAWGALLDVVTVQETRFYRNAPQLDTLAEVILPKVRREGRPLRLLSAGCAPGEEAWTLGMLALDLGVVPEVVGLDLCRPALAVAAAGIYHGPPDPLLDLPERYRCRLVREALAEPGPGMAASMVPWADGIIGSYRHG